MIPPVEEQIANEIISDLNDRNGFRQEWEQIDDEIKYEIREVWIKIIKTKLIDSGMIL